VFGIVDQSKNKLKNYIVCSDGESLEEIDLISLNELFEKAKD